MGELVNLKRVKKRLANNAAGKQAELNRLKFGRTKSDRDNDVAKAARASKTLDQHKLPGDDAT